MYNERTNFSIKNVIIQFLFIALFIFVLIWLFPLKSDLKNLGSNDSTDLSVLTDRIFNENIIAMKDDAKSYYTLERLPQNVGDKVKMTLGEMLDKKITLPFKDKNGKSCSLTDSYVEVTKHDTEYVMKVNLKCSDEENYLLVYMGCYDYCSTTICEKNASDISTPVIYKAKKETKTKTETKKNVINKIIDIVVPDEKHYCEYRNGKYYDKSGNVVSESAYKASCEKVEVKHYCEYVNGKYYDKNGNVVSKEEYKKSCETPVVIEYLYEYSKTNPSVCSESDWSNWSTTPVSASYNTKVQSKTVTKKRLKGYNVKTALDKTKPIYGTKEINTGATTTKKVCTAYGNVATGEYTYSDWAYVGDVYLTYSPSDSDSVKYVWVDDSNWVCGENCTSGTTHKYMKYTRTKTPITRYQCTNWETKTVPVTTTVRVITGYETKIVSKTPVYDEVSTKYYRYKTKSCTKESTSTKWSTYNDKSLLNAGYNYTGNKKQK